MEAATRHNTLIKGEVRQEALIQLPERHIFNYINVAFK